MSSSRVKAPTLGLPRRHFLALLTLSAILLGLAAGHQTGSASPAWCDRNEKWRGTPLLTEERYDLWCSGVVDISVESPPTQSLRFLGDKLSFEVALHLQEPRSFSSTEVLYTAFVYPLAQGCADRSIQRAWASRGADFKLADVTVACSFSRPGEYILYVSSGGALLRFPVVVPSELPTRAEYEAAERAKRPRVEVTSVTAGESRTYGGRFTITIRNNHSLAIEIIRFGVYPRDRWGNAITRCGYYGGWWEFWGFGSARDGATVRLSDDEACWSGLSELGINIQRVKFVDGSIWSP